MFKKMTLNVKLISLFLLVGIIPMGITWAISYTNSSKALNQSVTDGWLANRDLKKGEIESFFQDVGVEVTSLAASPFTVEAVKEMSAAFHNAKAGQAEMEKMRLSVRNYYANDFNAEFKKKTGDAMNAESLMPSSDAGIIAQYNYLSNNQNPLGSKMNLMQATDGGAYSKIHPRYHNYFKYFMENNGFYDVFLVDAESGDIVYTAAKEVDFGTNLKSGAHSSSSLGKAYKEALANPVGGFFKVTDFEPYKASYTLPASFISSPIMDGNKLVGVAILQISIDEIDTIMTSDKKWKDIGFGDSGETYLVGPDHKLRSNARGFVEDKSGFITVLKNAGVITSAIKYLN